jgi:hypothetical protein
MTESAHCGRQVHMTAHALRAVRNTAIERTESRSNSGS